MKNTQIYKVSFERTISTYTPQYLVHAPSVIVAVRRATRKARREFDRKHEAIVTSVKWEGSLDA